MPIAIAASLLADIAWVYLLVAHGGFWRTDQRLPPDGPAPARWPAIVAVVPARDEAAIVPETLPTLLAQDYDGPFSVVLVDDESSDGTSDVAAALSVQQVWRGRLRVVAGRHGRLRLTALLLGCERGAERCRTCHEGGNRAVAGRRR